MTADTVQVLPTDVWTSLQDAERLAALEATSLLDSPSEQAFDRLTHLVSRLLSVPVALISLVDTERQFFKSATGLPEPWCSLRQTPLSHSFCQHVVTREEPLVVPDAREHPLVCDNLAVSELDVIGYLGVPLRTPEGFVLGSLCAIDGQPRAWTEDQVTVLSELAGLVMTEIELRHQLEQRKDAELALARNTEALRKSNERLQQFAAMAAHDLRAPLNTITGFVRLLRQKCQDAMKSDVEQMIGFIESATTQMAHQISSLLADSDASTPKEDLAQHIDLNTVLEEVCRAIQADIHEARAQITSDELPVLPGDQSHLYALLINLLTNSLKYRSDRSLRISVTSTAEEKHHVIRVSDNGLGIDPVFHQRIFEIYGRSYEASAVEGTGLGLAKCKQIVERYGGSIWVTSQAGKGATFAFRWPA